MIDQHLTPLQRKLGAGTARAGALMAESIKRTARAAHAERVTRELAARDENEFAADLITARGGDLARAADRLDADAPGVAAVLRARMREALL